MRTSSNRSDVADWTVQLSTLQRLGVESQRDSTIALAKPKVGPRHTQPLKMAAGRVPDAAAKPTHKLPQLVWKVFDMSEMGGDCLRILEREGAQVDLLGRSRAAFRVRVPIIMFPIIVMQ